VIKAKIILLSPCSWYNRVSLSLGKEACAALLTTTYSLPLSSLLYSVVDGEDCHIEDCMSDHPEMTDEEVLIETAK
jgi:hypothetical protein